MVYALAIGELIMGISALVEKKAIEGYIKHNGNKTLTYLEAHPSADYEIADAHGSEFVGNCGIEQKAIAILEANPKLNSKTLLNSLSEECEATKSQFYKGEENISPDFATRLAAKRTVLLDLYGLGNKSPTTAIQNNIINVDAGSIDKVNKGLSDLFEKSSALIDKLNNAKEI
jgi:hypothetical protein